MTSAEQQQLAAIAAQLSIESPELVRAFGDGSRRTRRASRRRWLRAGVLTALVSRALLVAGAAAGVAALAVFSVCPLLSYLALAGVQRYRGAPVDPPG